MQETLEEAKRYEMQHLAYLGAKQDLERTYKHHKDDSPKQDITVLYPFPESKVSELSGEYDSQITYYSASLIAIYKSLAEELPWVKAEVKAGSQKEYDTDAEAEQVGSTTLDNGDVEVSYAKPSHDIPTVELEVTIDMAKYNKEDLDKVIVEFS